MNVLPDLYSIIIILIAVVIMFCYVYCKPNIYFKNIVFIGFFVRVILLFADYYHWFPLLNSGADSERFHGIAFNNATSLFQIDYNNGYVHFLTLVYRLTACSRMLAQFINILFGMGIIFITQSSMRLLGVDRRNFLIATCVLSFLPNLNIFSAILLREAWIEFFVACSVYFFIRWFKSGLSTYIILTIASVLAGAYMHAGVIGLIFGYAIAFISYNPSSQKISFSATTIIAIVLMLGIEVALSSHVSLFTSKFEEYDNMNNIVDVVNTDAKGNSAYLTWISSNSIVSSLLFAPLKMFYFLFCPLPTEWHRFSDVLGFLIDGMIYMILCYTAFKNRTQNAFNKTIKQYLTIALLLVTFIFGYGTNNAGTAFRHKTKLMPLIVTIYALSSVKKGEEIKEEEDKIKEDVA